MRTLIVSRDNGLGLSKDADVIRDALQGIASVDVMEYESKPSGQQYDIVFFMEHVPPHLTGQSARNWYLPNAEWHVSDMSQIQTVMAKTWDCANLFRGAHYIGWTSPDMYDASVPKQKRLLHVAGGSIMKGTSQVMEAMRLLPDIQLDLVAKSASDLPPNVKFHGRVSDARMRELMNQSVLHLCPSSYEGFGHYLNEARSTGAAIISTNAEPMSELVGENGFLAGYSHTSDMAWAKLKHVCPESLAWMIRRAMATPLEDLVAMGKRARSAYLSGRTDFRKAFRALVRTQIDAGPPNITVDSDYGPIVVNRHDKVIGASIRRIGYWAPDDIKLILRLIRSLPERRGPAMIYDVGANIGTHTLAIAKTLGSRVTVRAFEAQRHVFDMLQETVRLNGLTNVRSHLNAVSDVGGKQIQIAVPDYDDENNFGGIELETAKSSDNGGVEKPGTEVVKTVTLDSFNERVDFVKMDIEGMEDRALRGSVRMIERHRPIVFVEVHKTDGDFVKTFFRSRGYDGFLRGEDLIAVPREYGIKISETKIF